MNRNGYPIVFRSALVVLLVTISYLAVTPAQYPIIEHVWDKLNHFLAFYALAFATDFAFPRREYGWRKAVPLLAYGGLIEIVQRFLPYRSAELLDLAADAAALVLYGLSLPLLRRLPLIRDRWSAPLPAPTSPPAGSAS